MQRVQSNWSTNCGSNWKSRNNDIIPYGYERFNTKRPNQKQKQNKTAANERNERLTNKPSVYKM